MITILEKVVQCLILVLFFTWRTKKKLAVIVITKEMEE